MHALVRQFASLLCTALLLVPTAQAENFPSKPIRLVVPFTAGGPADIQARWVASRLSASLGQQVLVDNKAGAGGIIGAQAVASAPADGYTLLFSSVGAVAIAPYLADKVPYDPKKDLVPVVRVATAPTLLVVGSASRFDSLASLVAFAKANPGKVSFASAGPATTTHLGSELLKREAGIEMVHVPYKGASPAVTDLIAGTVDVMFVDAPVVLPFLKSGKLKALAVGTTERTPALPDVRTTAEGGYRNVLVSTWYGVLAPAKTPKDILAKVNAAINALLATSDAATFFGEQGVKTNGGSADDFAGFIATESARWTALAKAVGAKMD